MLINKLRENQSVKRLVEEAALLGRQSFDDLDAVEREDIVDACVEAIDKDDLAEIIIEGIQDTSLHEFLAERRLAKDSLDKRDAVIEMDKDLNKYLLYFFEDYITQLISDAVSELQAEQKHINYFLDRDVFNRNPFKLIPGAMPL